MDVIPIPYYRLLNLGKSNGYAINETSMKNAAVRGDMIKGAETPSL